MSTKLPITYVTLNVKYLKFLPKRFMKDAVFEVLTVIYILFNPVLILLLGPSYAMCHLKILGYS